MSNPKISVGDRPMTAGDWITTVVQIVAVVGGVALAATGNPLGVAIAAAALSGGARGNLAVDALRGAVRRMGRGGGAGILVVLLAASVVAGAGCSANHPFLRPAGVAAAGDVAKPYLLRDCEEVELCACYRLDWAAGEAPGDPDFAHGFGGIVGGCGLYAKVSCTVIETPDPGGGPAARRVVCEVADTLREDPSAAH